MIKSIFIFGLMIALVAIHSGPAYSESKTVTLATLTDFAPYCFRIESSAQITRETIPPGSDSAQLQGYSWDVVRESFHEVGYTIVLYVVPWARAMHYLNNGKVDAIFPANRTEEREEKYIFSEGYVERTRIAIYVPADSSLVWQGPSSLGNSRVGAVRGWSYGKAWENSKHITKELVDSIAQSFSLLDRKRIDAVIGYEIAYDYMLKSQGKTAAYNKAGYLDEVDEFLMGKKNNTAVIKILSAYDRGHQLLEKKGGLEEIGKAWQ
jgi:polar amino acid transport system substrate-binding protein